MGAKKIRIDTLLVSRGLAPSREKAQALILAGEVRIGARRVDKAGALVPDDSDVRLQGELPYVSRGGLKLEAALKTFGIDPTGLPAMDIGASTGGFTDCLLQHGAPNVVAIDVGYGQMDWSLRNDSRVILLEKTNIRHLDRSAVEGRISIVVIDVSFISLRLVLPKAVEFLEPGGVVVALVKPQFELTKADVGKGGVVRDETKREAAVQSVREAAEALHLEWIGTTASPILGAKGNQEFLVAWKKPGHERTAQGHIPS